MLTLRKDLHWLAYEFRDSKIEAQQERVDDYTAYRRLAGEVESRNVQERAGMSMAERLNSLLSETEDVFEEDKIYLQKMIGDGMMMDRKKKDSIAVTSPSGLSQRTSDYREHSNSRTKDPVGAALQSIESDINIASLDDNVKGYLERIYNVIKGDKIPAKSFITSMRNAGFMRSHEGGSAYLNLNDSTTIRLSDPSAGCIAPSTLAAQLRLPPGAGASFLEGHMGRMGHQGRMGRGCVQFSGGKASPQDIVVRVKDWGKLLPSFMESKGGIRTMCDKFK